jgi:serine/threonine-protein kinase
MRLGPGQWLNAQLQLLSWLGEELHGESFLAEQRPPGRSVLIKVLSADACRTAAYIKRFRHCAERAMLLAHQHAAAVYAFGLLPGGGEGGELPWLATDPIEGPDLRSLLVQGMTPAALASQLLPVADVLDRAAALGFCHGEVSPGSLVLVGEGAGDGPAKVVLTDLGLAKVLASDILDVPAPPGLLSYRSPEQCQDGEQVGSAADRYALATILYESLVGRPPFVDGSPRLLLQLHRSAPVPPLRTLAPQLMRAEALDAFFVQALAKEPAARFASATAMMEEFLAALTVPHKGGRPAARRSPRWYRMLRDGDESRSFDIVVGPRAVLGKQSECDVVCQARPSPEFDPITGTISREHVVLIWLDNRLSVLDQSVNGTFVNDRRVGRRLSALPDGALLRLGEHLTVEVALLMGSQPVGDGPQPGALAETAGALLSRRDRYAIGLAPTLMLWQTLPLFGSPLSRLGGAMRCGQIWVAQRELWWSGHPAVVWQRQDRTTVLGPAPLRDGDTLADREAVLRVVH